MKPIDSDRKSEIHEVKLSKNFDSSPGSLNELIIGLCDDINIHLSNIYSNIYNIEFINGKKVSFNDIETYFIGGKNILVDSFNKGIGLSLSNIAQKDLLKLYKTFFRSHGIIMRTNRKCRTSLTTSTGEIFYD
ncbi:MAG: hypothetical protein LBK52_07560, partial [Deltaproteobacteria bacterium]|nr:hypothetical protein [Deltaproteobacteria bacterium]